MSTTRWHTLLESNEFSTELPSVRDAYTIVDVIPKNTRLDSYSMADNKSTLYWKKKKVGYDIGDVAPVRDPATGKQFNATIRHNDVYTKIPLPNQTIDTVN